MHRGLVVEHSPQRPRERREGGADIACRGAEAGEKRPNLRWGEAGVGWGRGEVGWGGEGWDWMRWGMGWEWDVVEMDRVEAVGVG